MSEVKTIDVKDVLVAIDDEPELPGPIPDEMWEKINGNRLATHAAIVAAVKITKENITRRIVYKVVSQKDGEEDV